MMVDWTDESAPSWRIVRQEPSNAPAVRGSRRCLYLVGATAPSFPRKYVSSCLRKRTSLSSGAFYPFSPVGFSVNTVDA